MRSIGIKPDKVEISDGMCGELCNLKLLSVRIFWCKLETRLEDMSRAVTFKMQLREFEIK